MGRATDMIRSTMRWTLPVLLAIAATGTARSADLQAYKARRYAPPAQVYVTAPPPPPVYVEDPALIAPPTTPILPGSSTLPGYYGRPIRLLLSGRLLRRPVLPAPLLGPSLVAAESKGPAHRRAFS